MLSLFELVLFGDIILEHSTELFIYFDRVAVLKPTTLITKRVMLLPLKGKATFIV